MIINKIILFFLLLTLPLLLYSHAEYIPFPPHSTGLPSIITTILLDEISKNDSLNIINKPLLASTIFDSLNNIEADILNLGYIAELEIDYTIRESSETLTHHRFLDVSLQIVYESPSSIHHVIEPFIRDKHSIYLSTKHQRLFRSFTIIIDDTMLVSESKVHEDIDSIDTVEVESTSSESRPDIYMVVQNGAFQGYSYQDIAARAFENRRLTDASIPDGIQSIGERAFMNNKLTVVNIPHSVKSIGASAFNNNRVEIISIGENVELGKNAIGRGFETFYNRNGKKAGVYVYENRGWSQE